MDLDRLRADAAGRAVVPGLLNFLFKLMNYVFKMMDFVFK